MDDRNEGEQNIEILNFFEHCTKSRGQNIENKAQKNVPKNLMRKLIFGYVNMGSLL